MNKNISIWRGDQAPPTKYHIWVKEDNSINIYRNGVWEKIVEGIKSSIRSINVNDLNSLNYVYDNFETEGSYFYRITNDSLDKYIELEYPHIFEKDVISTDKLCYFNKTDYQSDYVPDTNNTILFETLDYNNYYNIVFENSGRLYALGLSNNDCIVHEQINLDNSCLWKFEYNQNDNTVQILNKNGEYIRYKQATAGNKAVWSYHIKDGEIAKFYIENTESGYVLKTTFSGHKQYLNINTGVGNGNTVITWNSPTHFQILTIPSPNFSKILDNTQYLLQFTSKSTDIPVIIEQSDNKLVSKQYDNTWNNKLWKFEGTVDNFQIIGQDNKCVIYRDEEFYMSEDSSGTEFKMVAICRRNNDQIKYYYLIKYENKNFDIHQGTVGNPIRLYDGTRENNLLNFKIIIKQALSAKLLENGVINEDDDIKTALLEKCIQTLQESLTWNE